MAFLAALPLIGKIVAPLLGKVFDVVDKSVADKDLAAQIKAQIQVKSMEIDHSEFATAITEQSNVIRAEAEGSGWLQRNWRPGIMAIFGLIIFNNYVLNPWLSALFDLDVVMEIPPEMWSLLKLGIGGYVAGRSAEKIMPGVLSSILKGKRS